MMRFFRYVPVLILIGYGLLFSFTERHFTAAHLQFSAPLPAAVQKVALGFLQHIGAEMLYVKAAIFLGADPNILPEEEAYAEPLAQNFETVSEVYPEFKDTYFLAQSSLAHVSPQFAGRVITILDRGVNAYPDDLVLPFFMGFNHYHYRDEATHAAAIFKDLATRPDAPSWLGHLGAILSARGGDLRAGLLSLRVVHAMEEDEYVKVRYANDIVIFEKVLAVSDATEAFRVKYGEYPQDLEQLVPEYVTEIPDVGEDFELLWIPPRLRLLRPE